jgi:acetyl-CoA carboxylase biotin carboxyl carrier protein
VPKHSQSSFSKPLLKKRKKISTAGPDPKVLEELHLFMSTHHLVEVEWEDKRGRIRLQSHERPVNTPFLNGSASAPSSTQTDPLQKPNTTSKQILSPFVGTFYRSSSPENGPYVREGQTIKQGDVLCIVEAMKLMNEIESECSGKIVSVLVENGQPVEFDEPLFMIEPA